MVLAIFRNGIAKAYPIRILNWHEVVNDRFGADNIVITFCPLCGSGAAFEAKAGGRALRFGVSGLLYSTPIPRSERGQAQGARTFHTSFTSVPQPRRTFDTGQNICNSRFTFSTAAAPAAVTRSM